MFGFVLDTGSPDIVISVIFVVGGGCWFMGSLPPPVNSDVSSRGVGSEDVSHHCIPAFQADGYDLVEKIPLGGRLYPSNKTLTMFTASVRNVKGCAYGINPWKWVLVKVDLAKIFPPCEKHVGIGIKLGR